jgi:nicotinamidase-related amidase
MEILEADKITELVVCGMMTHMCIDTTVRAAKDHEIPVTLISDACATKDMLFEGTPVSAVQVQSAFMAALSGMFANITTASIYIGQ